MGVERLRAFLRRHRRIALDTSIFIYHLEANSKYLACTDLIFSWIERAECKALTSTITMTELLVLPYRKGDEQRANDFCGLLSTYPNLDWIAPNLEIAELAARIRALHRLQTPDALQAATATHSQATALITNDAVFERVEGFQTLVLDRLL
ncbi:MAG TPA: PIN domain-containing protein [Terriglobales bacterium]|nr:PIN domain-containing protein [Terriglobales bacterium]